jgi:hypothetical protein
MKNDELDPNLKILFNDLQNIPQRNQQAAARGRDKFMKEVEFLQKSFPSQADHRISSWINGILSITRINCRLPVWNTLVAVVLVLVVFFGGSSVTVYASQDSLPNQILYPVKIWSEDAILSVTGSPQMRLNYVLDFSDRRVSEIRDLLASGATIPQIVETRLQDQLDLALELIASMDDSLTLQHLEQARLRAYTQSQMVAMLISSAPESAEPLLLSTYEYLQEQIRLSTLGKTDFQGFRMQIRQRYQNEGDPVEKTPGSSTNTQDSNLMSSTDLPVPSETGNGSGPMTPTNIPSSNATDNNPGPTSLPGRQLPSETMIIPGSGGYDPGGTQCSCGSGSHTPEKTPQPGGGPGKSAHP